MTTTLPELAALAGVVGSATVDGVPVVFTQRDGPVSGGIFFRVGRADETLATSGITHLVEHLALVGHSTGDIHHNGETADTYTHFHVTGSEAQVVAYLNGVCASLRDLPIHRLATEKEILRTEAARTTIGTVGPQRTERYGARGAGTTVHGEPGLHRLTTEDVLEWARTRFTRGNAAVWMSTSHLPDGLDLALPEGERIHREPVTSMAGSRPAWFPGREGAVMIDAHVRRSPAAALFAQVASKALFRALRTEGGYSYAVQCLYEPIDSVSARVTVYADALAEQQAAVIGETIDVLAGLRAGVIDERDLAAARDAIRQIGESSSITADMLPRIAVDLLDGEEIIPIAAHIERYEAVSTAQLATVADELWNDAIAQVPGGSLDWAGFSRVSAWSQSTVAGARYPRLGEPDTALIIGSDGVSFVTPSGSATVRLDACEAYLTVPDGGRSLIGSDGFTVRIEPALHYGITPEVIAALDERIPPHVVIPLPARPADHVPTPPVTVPFRPSKPVRWRGLGVWATVLLVPLLPFTALLVFGSLLSWSDIGTVDETGEIYTLDTAVGLLVVAILLSPTCAYLVAGRVHRRRWKRALGSHDL